MLKTKISYAAVSAVLLFLSFPPFNYSYFVFAAFVPLIISLEDSTYKQTVIISIVFTTIFTLGILSWIYIYHIIALPGILIIFNAYFLTMFFLYSFIIRRLYYIDILVFPIVWTSIEYLRSAGNMGFPWGTLGYTQYKFIQFIQISDIIGVFGISFIICLINSIIAYLILSRLKNNKLIIQSVITVIIIFLIMLYGFDKIEDYKNSKLEKKLSVGISQLNLSPYFDLWDKQRNEIAPKIINSMDRLLLRKPDLIILSETIILDDLFSYNAELKKLEWKNFQWKYLLSKNSSSSGTHIFFGTQTYKLNKENKFDYFNSAVFLSPDGEIIGSYNKIHLVPFGEFTPFYNKYEFVKKIADSFQCGNFTPGNEMTVFDNGNYKIAPLICYESIFHNLSRIFAKNGADFFINITNDAWTNSVQAHCQHFAMNVFTAVQNHLPLLRCGNSGISGIINEIGEINYESTPLAEENLLLNFVYHPDKKGSFYMRYGDIFSNAVIIFFGLILFVSFFFPVKIDEY
ncbi:MAG TPA: apolipoprotein N-acyltransferase [bacterium]|nr:apolipoprotein N-acyltransferase [bacterium]HPN31950.1 apolipoprotein N-acyltransferase [bacterium]